MLALVAVTDLAAGPVISHDVSNEPGRRAYSTVETVVDDPMQGVILTTDADNFCVASRRPASMKEEK